eukprot:UN03224
MELPMPEDSPASYSQEELDSALAELRQSLQAEATRTSTMTCKLSFCYLRERNQTKRYHKSVESKVRAGAKQIGENACTTPR